MDEIIYLSFDDILMYYCDTIKQSGGGMSGIRERSGIEMVLDLVQNDLYYPSFEEKLDCEEVVSAPVVTDGHIITGRGMGAAIAFALKLTELLFGEKKADEIAESIVYKAD